jgi:Do/DeqQ family serine protease
MLKALKSFVVYCLLLVMLAASISLSFAQEEKTVPQSRAAMTQSFAPIVKKAAPAVVNIYTKRRVQQAEENPLLNDPLLRHFFGKGFTFGGRARDQVVSSLGSGVIVKSDGLVVTSHHVIKDAQQITVVLSDKREYEARIVLKDPQSDLAFLRIDPSEKLPALELRNSDELEVGDLILAIGNPFGVGQTVTSGIISALARKAAGVSDYQFFIQTDAAINPGNSGGALVDMNGRLIGINTAIYSKSGGSVGIGFSIPSNMVSSLMNSKVQGGRVVRPWIGMSVQPVTAEIAESIGLKSPAGVIVRGLYPDSPAEKAGIKEGDIVFSVDGSPISNEQEMHYRLALSRIGETTTLDVMRKGDRGEREVTLVAPPENPKRDQRTLVGKHPLNGFTVANLSPALSLELGIDNQAARGVVVLAGSNTTIAATIPPGAIILEVNDKKITSTAQLADIMEQRQRVWTIVFQQGTNVMTLTVKMPS